MLENLKRNCTPSAIDAVVEKVALRTHAALVTNTPRGYTGMTARSWIVGKLDRGYYVTNTNKVALFLEEGTAAHGPVEKKALFIPLDKAAALNGWNPGLIMGVDYILRKMVAGIWNGAFSKRDPRGFIAAQRKETQEWLATDMRTFIRTAVQV